MIHEMLHRECRQQRIRGSLSAGHYNDETEFARCRSIIIADSQEISRQKTDVCIISWPEFIKLNISSSTRTSSPTPPPTPKNVVSAHRTPGHLDLSLLLELNLLHCPSRSVRHWLSAKLHRLAEGDAPSRITKV